MKKLWLAIGGLAVTCACGGGGGGGGSGTTPPTSPPALSVSISPSAQSNIDQGQTVSFTATVANDASGKGVTWSASGPGISGAVCGTFTNTTTSAAMYVAPAPVSANLSITVTATSVADPTKTSSAAVMVAPPPSITTTVLPTATPNASYSATLQATGGVGALTWTVASGALPAGLSLSSSGAITGNPTVSGTSAFTMQVTDSSAPPSGPASAQVQLSLTVVPVLSISTTSLPAGSQGAGYQAAVVASGGTPPYTWSLTTGSLPTGLTMVASSGVISGTPTAPGAFTFTISVEDSSPMKQTQAKSLTITIGASQPLVITTTALVNATPNASYSATLEATGGVGALTWTLISGALPVGLSVSSSGAITGNPSVSGTFTFTVQVTDSSTPPISPASAQAQLSLTVVPVLIISTTSMQGGSEGIAYQAGMGAGGGTPPYTWSLTTGSLPAGLTMQPSSGGISGVPSVSGTFTFTVGVQDSSPTRQTQTKSLSIAIAASQPLAIGTSALPSATPNANYSATLQATGGVGTLTWALASGALPAGLSLSTSGAITGNPTVSGRSTFTVQVTDSSALPGGPSSTQAQLSLTVVPSLSISTMSLPAGSEGVTYQAEMVAGGGTAPYTWSLTTGSLPAGLTMQPDSGVISGVPSAPGTFTFIVNVQDSGPTRQTQTKSLTITIGASQPLAIVTTALTNATPNASYNATLEATGGVGALTWTLISGALPTGLSLSSSGAITGDPTVSGNSTFTVQVTDSSALPGGPASAQAQFSLTVVPAMSISTTSLPGGAASTTYEATMLAGGGTPPYTWSLMTGALPTGLTMHPGSGAISGVPTSPGTFTFTVSVQDSSPTEQTQTQSLSIVIGAPQPLAITTTTLINASPNTNYSATLQATGGVGALTWTLTNGILPTGLSLSSSGVISGDPIVSGTPTFTVQVADSASGAGGPDLAEAQLRLTVVTMVSITTAALPGGSQGVAYLAAIDASGGTPPYAWRLMMGSLPPGLTMEPSSGVISGSPASQGSYTFTVTVQDSSPTMQTQIQSLTIAIGVPGPLAITAYSLPDGTVSAPYNATVAATGGTPPYTWSIATGALPAGFSLAPSTGAIWGTPSSTGTANFTVMVTDSSSTPEAQTQELSLAVVTAAEACASSGNNTALSGPYAYILSGFNDVGFLTVVGSFTADGTGRITAGEVDTNGVFGAQHGNILTSASSYSVGPDNRGCATLATPFGTFATHFALGSMSSNIAAGGRMIEWDSPSASAYIAAGQLLRQTSSAFAGGLTGSYIFHTIGWDPAQGGRAVCVGVMSASGNTFNSMEEDCNDALTVANAAAPDVAGTYTPLDSNGRGTGIIAQGESNANITFYAVSGSQLLAVNADPAPFLSGEWDQQNVPAGGSGFTQASLKGNMVFYLDGLTLLGTATAVSMETATADGTSSLTINFYMDRAGTMQISSPYACAYTVEPNGRVTLGSSTQSCGSNAPVFYLTDVNTGFLVDGAAGVDTGAIEPQSAGSFTNASLAGNFFGGLEEVALQGVQAEVEPVTLDGSGSMTGAADICTTTALDAGAPFLAATYSVNPDGTFSVRSSNGAVAGIIISSSKLVMISPSTTATPYPTLLLVQK